MTGSTGISGSYLGVSMALCADCWKGVGASFAVVGTCNEGFPINLHGISVRGCGAAFESASVTLDEVAGCDAEAEAADAGASRKHHTESLLALNAGRFVETGLAVGHTR